MENWKSVVGYEGFYEVSDRGRIRTTAHRVENKLKNSGYRTVPAKIVKPCKKKNGYLAICLCKDGVAKTLLVHRLVAEAFLEQSDGTKKIVNHKNLNKTDNRIENLEWCMHKENTEHAIKNGAIKPSTLRKQIVCVETGAKYPSSYQAALWLNETKYRFSKDVAGMSRKIRACVIGTQLTAYGYHWRDM